MTTTLAIDIGGTGLKMLVLDSNGKAITERSRVLTPKPATPDAILDALASMKDDHGKYDRISAGFPGVVRQGITLNAPNLDGSWAGFPLADQLEEVFGCPARVANDADVQGYGAISGIGVELTVTLGTGVGSGLFLDGQLVPNLELGHAPFRKRRSYEDELGKAALEASTKSKWNKRLSQAIGRWQGLFNYDRLYLGGGNAKKINTELPSNVTIVDNRAGLLGGIALWTSC